MKRNIFLYLICLGSFGITAQTITNGDDFKASENDISRPDESDSLAVLKFKPLQKKNVLWSTMVWEIIDLRQKFNFPLYFPIDTLNPNRLSLFEVLLRGIKSNEIKNVYVDDYFLEKIKPEEIEESLVIVDTTARGFEQLNAGEEIDPSYINVNKIASNNIERYNIKGQWYFDRLLGEMKYRLLGICPIGKSASQLEKDDDPYPLFWVFYPDARQHLQNHYVYLDGNYSRRLTFDHVLLARRFQSIIYKEDNEYMDRQISDYVKQNAFYQLLESNRIKESIRDFELDLWEY